MTIIRPSTQSLCHPLSPQNQIPFLIPPAWRLHPSAPQGATAHSEPQNSAADVRCKMSRYLPVLVLTASLACSAQGAKSPKDAASYEDDGLSQLGDSPRESAPHPGETASRDFDGGDTSDPIASPPDDLPPSSTDLPETDFANDVAPDSAHSTDTTNDTASTFDTSPDLPSEPPPLFDLNAIRDATTAECDFHDHHTVFEGMQIIDAWRLTYWSWESRNGTLHPIKIRAFAARPAGSGTVPGIVFVHGLGGYAEESYATSQAALLGMFVIAYTGPGGGKPDDPNTQSEGIPAQDPSSGSFYRLFDTVPDPRGSWLWGHAVAAMRAVTCLTTRSDVDPGRIGITGGSAGAMVSLIAAGLDDRIQAALPLSGTGAFDIAVQSQAAWQHALLAASGLTTESPQWHAFLQYLDPIHYVPSAKAAIFMVNGSSDEFFPLTAHVATYDAIPMALERRTSIVANFDHGCYQVAGIEPKDKIDERVSIRFGGNERAWFQHHFGTNSTYSRLPADPTVQVTEAQGLTLVAALVDPGTEAYEVEQVLYWFSNDDAYTFLSVELKDQGGGLFGGLVPAPLQPNTVYYVDVQYKTKSFFAPERFAISSRPHVPDGLIPHIRQWGTCL